MRLSPIDLLNKKFPKAISGYAPSAVDDCLREIAGDYEGVVTENARLHEVVESLEREIERFRAMESTLKEALILAQKTADEARSNARRDADELVRNARLKADEIVVDAENRAESLHRQRVRFTREFKMLLQSYLESMESDMTRTSCPEGLDTAEDDDRH